jgi:hypothetical protein
MLFSGCIPLPAQTVREDNSSQNEQTQFANGTNAPSAPCADDILALRNGTVNTGKIK